MLIYEYQLDPNIIKKCTSEGKDISDENIEIEVQKILKDNDIKYENKLVEYWESMRNFGRGSEYHIKVQVYIDSKDEETSRKLLKEYLTSKNDYTVLDTGVQKNHFSEKYKKMFNIVLIVLIILVLIIVLLSMI